MSADNGGNLTFSCPSNYTKLFDALSHPMRIKIIGELSQQRRYVSELAKLMNMSRPLLYMHLRKLEEANIVAGSYEISEAGKSMRYYEARRFLINLSPELLFEISKHIEIEQDNK